MMTSKHDDPAEGADIDSAEEPESDDTLAKFPDRSHFSEFDQAIAEGLRPSERRDEPTEDEQPRT